MALANVIPPPYAVETGTTNISSITWNRVGNVVNVAIDGYTTSTPNVNVTITGLPLPKGNAYQKQDLFAAGVWHGYIEQYQGSWVVKTDGYTLYGSLTYICE